MAPPAPEPSANAPAFQTLNEALDYAARHGGRELAADYWQRDDATFGFVEVPADEAPRAAPLREGPLPLGGRVRGGL